MNQCSECDDWFLETEDNPGCLCEKCKKLISEIKAKQFFEEIEKL